MEMRESRVFTPLRRGPRLCMKGREASHSILIGWEAHVRARAPEGCSGSYTQRINALGNSVGHLSATAN